jgi:hypothetical protein
MKTLAWTLSTLFLACNAALFFDLSSQILNWADNYLIFMVWALFILQLFAMLGNAIEKQKPAQGSKLEWRITRVYWAANITMFAAHGYFWLAGVYLLYLILWNGQQADLRSAAGRKAG